MPQSMRVAPSQPGARPGRFKAWLGHKSTIAFFMTLPLMILIAVLVVYPAIYAVHLAMLNKRMTEFVGLKNFTFLFTARDVLDGGAAELHLRRRPPWPSKPCSASSSPTSSTTCRPTSSANGAACC